MTKGRFYVLEGDRDREQWELAFRQSSHREVFAHPSYLDLFAGPGDRPLCLMYEQADHVVMYPILVRDLRQIEGWGQTLNEPMFDAVSPPYGYCGPFISGPDSGRPELCEEFYQSYDEWARSENLIAEYVSFSPKCAVPLGYRGVCADRAPTVVRNLDMSSDELWMDYKGSVRTDVKAAIRNGVSINNDGAGAYSSDFLRVYSGTMDRRQAAVSYRVDEDFLQQIHSTLAGSFTYFHARHEGEIISTELVLLSGNSSFFFRGGTQNDKLKTKANVMLKHEIATWSLSQGLECYLLGGGNSAEDSLFKYKKSFAPRGVQMLKVGKWSVDSDAIKQVTDTRADYERAQGREWSPNESFFPPYRS